MNSLFDGRVCKTCGVWKPLEQFPNNRHLKGTECVKCKSERNRVQRNRLASENRYSSIIGKECSHCEVWKPADAFSRASGALDGLQHRCKECAHAIYLEYKPRHKELHRKWIAANKDRVEAARRRRYAANLEHYRAKNRDSNARYPDRVRATKRAWVQRNPDTVLSYVHRRRALRLGNGGQHSASEWRALCEYFNHSCVCCGAQVRLTRDHVIPLSQGGTDNIDNIQPLCWPCNGRKHDKTLDYRDPKRLAAFLASLHESGRH